MIAEEESWRATADYRLAISLLALVILSLASIIWMLDWQPTAQSLTLVGGLAGASAALLSVMLRVVQTAQTPGRSRSRRLAAVITYPAGFLAGAFSVLASLAFLKLPFAEANLPGAAMLGGIYGLMLGAYWAKVAESAATRDTLLAPGMDAVRSGLGLATVGMDRTNWSGNIVMSAERVKGEVIIGELRARFEPNNWEGPPIRANTEAVSGHATSTTPLRIEDGSDGTHADFVVTVSGGSERSVFPRRQAARVPTDDVSPEYIFKLLVAIDEADGSYAARAAEASATKDATAGAAAGKAVRSRDALMASKEETPVEGTDSPILVDISMAGRTVQVIEMHLPPRTL